VTKAARTLIDLAAVVHPDVVEEAVDDALRRGLVSIPILRRRLDELGGRGGRRGVARMRDLIEDRAKEGVPRSVFETKMARMLKRSGLPVPVRQCEVAENGRTLAILDFAYPDHRIGIETDGYRWHSGLARWRRDRRRHNELVARGWRMVYITWDELRTKPDHVASSIRRVLGAEVLSPEAAISSSGDNTSSGPG
jgi:very-short-patch-repair endonuclease